MPGHAVRDGAWAVLPKRPWTPLALTLGLHLLLVLAWLGAAQRGERAPPLRESAVVFVQPAARPVPRNEAAPEAPPAVPPRPRKPARPEVALTAPTPGSIPEPAPADLAAPVDPVTEAAAPDAAPAPLPGELLATSKRMAGAVDRALRKGSSPITAEPDRKWERFADLVAGARTGVSFDTRLESHTAADGVTIYRKTVGNRVRCYIGGSVGGLGPADGRSAGLLRACPTGVSWTRH